MLEELLKITAGKQHAGMTIRDVLQKDFGVSRRLLVRAKYQGEIRRNNLSVYVTERLQEGDEVRVLVPAEEEMLAPEPMELAIRHEDDDILVIAKPAGLVVHPTGNHDSHTLANGVAYYWQQRGEQRRFRPVNRLDKDTSGLMIVAKNQWAHEQFSRMQKERNLHRHYLAVVEGEWGETTEGVIDAPIGLRDDSIITRQVRPDGQPAVTRFSVRERGEGMTLVELKLETGRTHQIRVHLSDLGYPLAGDDLYGGSRTYIGRQALHAARLCFVHPRTGQEMEWREPLPEDMERLLQAFFRKRQA
ncbi:RluA family pseudouridine synthase [Brevibacillus ruminantium]|uniref:Pseudouridine synthase n=1 Tax=Brevibacillus ruminantium TaxID=2950604 RepID=A0ABY4WKH2_9BACL|nr:RluA family pseudouridine synthase [Brevibacillus ruminantium]USG67261.1 RluA family pseudouridine synthase [Brevibacillus ruminantium]